MTDITLITAPELRADTLSDQDYRDMYDELREHRSLSEFRTLTQTAVSRSWWSQYEAGVKRLDWQRKNELRRVCGLPLLAPSVAAALADVDPAATVWRVGEGVPDRVLQIATETRSGLLLRVNGQATIVDLTDRQGCSTPVVTPVTGHRKTRPRKRYHRPCLTDEEYADFLAWRAERKGR